MDQPKLHCRDYLPKDMSAIMEIEQQNFKPPWTKEDFSKCVTLRKAKMLVIEVGEKVVGFLMYVPAFRHFEIISIAVHEKYYRKRVGTLLIRKMIHLTRSHFKDKLILMVRESSLVVQLFLKFNQFKAVSVERNYYEDTDESAYQFELSFEE